MGTFWAKNGGLLFDVLGIIACSQCPCDSVPCESCLSLLDWEADRTEVPPVPDIGVTALSMSPTQACTGDEFTITFDITNSTGGAWSSDSTDKFYFAWEVETPIGQPDSIEVVSSSPAYDRYTDTGTIIYDRQIEWDTSWTNGETKTFVVTFRMNNCAAGHLGEIAVNFGYRTSISWDCGACP